MKYFNGFCLDKEQELFTSYLNQSDFAVAGFSYGAIHAFEYTLTCKERIDTLQLFSPAFFQDRDATFKKLQTLSFSKNKMTYCETFLKNIALPSQTDMMPYFKQGSAEALYALLHYVWDTQKVKILQERGIKIEVYLGEGDTIINPLHVKDFFVPFASVYYIKHVGHILR